MAHKEICNDLEGEMKNKMPMAVTALEEAWWKYQEVLCLILEDEVMDEHKVFIEMEEAYEATIDKAHRIIKDAGELELTKKVAEEGPTTEGIEEATTQEDVTMDEKKLLMHMEDEGKKDEVPDPIED